MKAIIRNMACGCCVKIMELLFQKLNIDYEKVQKCEVIFRVTLTREQIEMINNELKETEHELVFDPEIGKLESVMLILREKVKKQENIDVAALSSAEEEEELKNMIERKTGFSKRFVSDLFKKILNTTPIHIFNTLKINRAKQMIEEGYSFGFIAVRLKYNSIAYFSAQFKEITGITPSEYKDIFKKNSIYPNLTKKCKFHTKKCKHCLYYE